MATITCELTRPNTRKATCALITSAPGRRTFKLSIFVGPARQLEIFDGVRETWLEAFADRKTGRVARGPFKGWKIRNVARLRRKLTVACEACGDVGAPRYALELARVRHITCPECGREARIV